LLPRGFVKVRHSTVAAALVNREIVRHRQQPPLRVIQRPVVAQMMAKSKESLLGQIFGCSRIPGLPQEVAEDRLLQLLKQRQDSLSVAAVNFPDSDEWSSSGGEPLANPPLSAMPQPYITNEDGIFVCPNQISLIEGRGQDVPPVASENARLKCR
jgi:hypothetical protein